MGCTLRRDPPCSLRIPQPYVRGHRGSIPPFCRPLLTPTWAPYPLRHTHTGSHVGGPPEHHNLLFVCRPEAEHVRWDPESPHRNTWRHIRRCGSPSITFGDADRLASHSAMGSSVLG